MIEVLSPAVGNDIEKVPLSDDCVEAKPITQTALPVLESLLSEL